MDEERTDNGIRFQSFVSGPHGAHFELYPEKQHTQMDIERAKRYLWREHDVRSIKVIRSEREK